MANNQEEIEKVFLQIPYSVLIFLSAMATAEEDKATKERLECEGYVKRIFDEFVKKKHPEKSLDLSKITSISGMGRVQYNRTWGEIPASPCLKLWYTHNGVELCFYKRVTTYLDDTDLFFDYEVKVDSVIIVNKKHAYYIEEHYTK
jgi:hypothetical protein